MWVRNSQIAAGKGEVLPMNVVGKVCIGMTSDEVIDELGPPDAVGGTSRKYKTPCVYKYGEVELHFRPCKDGKLVMAYTEDEQANGIVLLRE